MMQNIHLKTYDEEAENRGYSIGIRGDRRKKPDKTDRIENLSAYAERGLLRFNRERKQSPDMIEVRRQFLGFPDAPHDDGPDAVESAIYMINKRVIKKPGTIRAVSYKPNHKRRPW